MAGDGSWEERACDVCGRPAEPPLTDIPDREVEIRAATGELRRVRLPRTLALCPSCRAASAVVGCCPRCRIWGSCRPWSPYGNPCPECGAEMVTMRLR